MGAPTILNEESLYHFLEEHGNNRARMGLLTLLPEYLDLLRCFEYDGLVNEKRVRCILKRCSLRDILIARAASM